MTGAAAIEAYLAALQAPRDMIRVHLPLPGNASYAPYRALANPVKRNKVAGHPAFARHCGL